jgi:Spy/CpxP family protein refolding chaperone
MWKKIVLLLIVLSVTLNVAFVGFWAARLIRSAWMVDGFGGDDEIACPLHRRLGTTPEQWERIEPVVTAFRNESQAVCREVTRVRLELLDLLAMPEPDMPKIMAKQDEILAGQRCMQELVIKHILTEKELLTPEQRRKLFDLLRQRSDCAGRGPIMGMQGRVLGDD